MSHSINKQQTWETFHFEHRFLSTAITKNVKGENIPDYNYPHVTSNMQRQSISLCHYWVSVSTCSLTVFLSTYNFLVISRR